MSSLLMLKKLAGDSVIYGISGIISRFIGIFLVPVYTRIFTPQDYGAISLVTNLFTLLSIVVILGMDNSVARWYYDDETDEDRKISLNTFLWSCFGAAAFFTILICLFHNFLAQRILKEPATATILLVTALNLPLTIFTTFTGNVLRIQRRAVATSVFTLVTSLMTIALNIVFVVVLRVGVIGVFYAQIITSAIAVVWTLALFWKLIDFRFFNRQRWKEMFLFSLPLIPGSVAFWVINLSGVYFIQSFQDAHEVGLYQIGTSLASAMALLTGAFQMAWGPFAFSIHKQENANRIYAQALTIYSAITSTSAVLITLFSYEVLSILTTPSYLGASLVAGILAYNYLIIGLGYIASVGTGIAKNNKMYGFASLASAIVLVILNLIIVPIFGKEGAALATLLSQIIIPIAIFWHAQKIYPIPYSFKKVLLIFFFGLFAGFGVLFLLSELRLGFYPQIAIKIAAALATVGLLLYILKSEVFSSRLATSENFYNRNLTN